MARPILIEFYSEAVRDKLLAKAEAIAQITKDKYDIRPDDVSRTMPRKPRPGNEVGPLGRTNSDAQRRKICLPRQIPQPVERQPVTTAPAGVVVIEDLLEGNTWVSCDQPDDDLVGNNSNELRGIVLATLIRGDLDFTIRRRSQSTPPLTAKNSASPRF
ncbi:unnamed protein product [Echinostoma caproni]|uniref:SH3 domain-containing protein n=1 Tax=Echinostoma caproni TaxID=27848 RepID=A0A183B5Q3_9TREM|nr:unnamed protein product [Echinostoma caproni]